MIILDTNVLSALAQQDGPDQKIVRWLDGREPEDVWTTAITLFELYHGVYLMPKGKKRDSLHKRVDGLIEKLIGERIFPYDQDAAMKSAFLHAARKSKGLNIEFRDTQIAGIALANSAKLATRNIRHFEDAGIALVNPWG